MRLLDRASYAAVGLAASPPQRSPALPDRPLILLPAATAAEKSRSTSSACSESRSLLLLVVNPSSSPKFRVPASGVHRRSSHHGGRKRLVLSLVTWFGRAT